MKKGLIYIVVLFVSSPVCASKSLLKQMNWENLTKFSKKIDASAYISKEGALIRKKLEKYGLVENKNGVNVKGKKNQKNCYEIIVPEDLPVNYGIENSSQEAVIKKAGIYHIPQEEDFFLKNPQAEKITVNNKAYLIQNSSFKVECDIGIVLRYPYLIEVNGNIIEAPWKIVPKNDIFSVDLIWMHGLGSFYENLKVDASEFLRYLVRETLDEFDDITVGEMWVAGARRIEKKRISNVIAIEEE